MNITIKQGIIGLLIFTSIFLSIIIWAYAGSGKKTVSNFFQSHFQYWFADYMNGGKVDIKQVSDGQYDLLVTMTSEAQYKKARAKARQLGQKKTKITPVKFPLSSWPSSGLFFAFFLALSLAAPFFWKRKLFVLLLGLPILYAFVISKFGISLFLKFSQFYDRFEVGSNSNTVIEIVNYFNLIISYPYFGLVFTAFLTIVLFALSGNFKMLLKSNKNVLPTS